MYKKTYFEQPFFRERILNYCPNYPTHRLYFGDVETPYTVDQEIDELFIDLLINWGEIAVITVANGEPTWLINIH